jgi:lipoprotein-releasing system permease protein
MGPFHIASIFIIFGLVVGLAGSALGIAAGYFICENIEFVEQTISSILGVKIWKSSTYLFTKIPAGMNWSAVGWIVTASTLASIAGSLIPAFSAARVEPVKILRYE